jgi:flagella basal body P-ring formation protein FlgA
MNRIISIISIGLSTLECGAQTTVSLNSSARITPNGPVTLAEIATVTGAEADTIGSIQILNRAVPPSPETPWTEIDLGTVRRVLESENINMGRTVLRGTTCTARFIPTERPPAPPTANAALPATPSSTPPADPGQPTIRDYIASSLGRLYRVQADDLRLSFDARDRQLLASSPGARRVSIEPTASGDSASMTVRVWQYDGDRQARTDAVSVRVLVRREVLTASASIDRGLAIDQTLLNHAEQWLSPAASTPATLEEAAGRIARMRITAGQVITRELVESPFVAQKGDLIEVHCLCGNVQVKASRARAQDKARDGEMVLLKLEGAGKTFRARMSGVGRAVLVVNDGADQ